MVLLRRLDADEQITEHSVQLIIVRKGSTIGFQRPTKVAKCSAGSKMSKYKRYREAEDEAEGADEADDCPLAVSPRQPRRTERGQHR